MSGGPAVAAGRPDSGGSHRGNRARLRLTLLPPYPGGKGWVSSNRQCRPPRDNLSAPSPCDAPGGYPLSSSAVLAAADRARSGVGRASSFDSVDRGGGAVALTGGSLVRGGGEARRRRGVLPGRPLRGLRYRGGRSLLAGVRYSTRSQRWPPMVQPSPRQQKFPFAQDAPSPPQHTFCIPRSAGAE